VSHVIDFTGDTSYSFTIPYLQQAGWQRTNTLQVATDTSPATNWKGRNGQWVMSVLNQLTLGNSTGTAEVFYAVWISGGPDFRVARLTSLPSNYVDGTVAPAMKGPKPAKKRGIGKEFKPLKQEKKNSSRSLGGFVKLAQSSEPAPEPTNMRVLFEQPFPTLIPTKVTLKKDITMGEEITSFSEMMRRYVFDQSLSGTGQSSYDFVINPWDFGINKINPLQRAARTFHFRRGSFRFKFQQVGNIANTWTVYTQNFVSGETLASTDQDGFTGWDIQQMDFIQMKRWIEVQIPFYFDYDMHCTCLFYDPAGDSLFDERANLPKLATTWEEPNGVSQDINLNMWMSVGDDWSQGWPVTPVILARSTVADNN